jgi:hypothetical protein
LHDLHLNSEVGCFSFVTFNWPGLSPPPLFGATQKVIAIKHSFGPYSGYAAIWQSNITNDILFYDNHIADLKPKGELYGTGTAGTACWDADF